MNRNRIWKPVSLAMSPEYHKKKISTVEIRSCAYRYRYFVLDLASNSSLIMSFCIIYVFGIWIDFWLLGVCNVSWRLCLLSVRYRYRWWCSCKCCLFFQEEAAPPADQADGAVDEAKTVVIEKVVKKLEKVKVRVIRRIHGTSIY